MRQLDLALDLGETARRIRVAPSLTVTATPDGRGVTLRTGVPEVWMGTREACALLGVDKHVLYDLGARGEIEGRQPAKPLAAIAARLRTNHKWEWLSASVLAYRQRRDEAQAAARIR